MHFTHTQAYLLTNVQALEYMRFNLKLRSYKPVFSDLNRLTPMILMSVFLFLYTAKVSKFGYSSLKVVKIQITRIKQDLWR